MTPPTDPRVPDPCILFSAEEIATRVEAMAREIANMRVLRKQKERIVAVCALSGAFVFAADLMRALSKLGVNPEMDFVRLASYGQGTVSSGAVTLVSDLPTDVSGRPVLFIDDILDSGRTLAYAVDHLHARGAWSVHSVVLLNKQVPRAVEIEADFVGFTCPDVFVVGYGMDGGGRFRGLPYVGIMER